MWPLVVMTTTACEAESINGTIASYKECILALIILLKPNQVVDFLILTRGCCCLSPPRKGWKGFSKARFGGAYNHHPVLYNYTGFDLGILQLVNGGQHWLHCTWPPGVCNLHKRWIWITGRAAASRSVSTGICTTHQNPTRSNYCKLQKH